MKVELENLIYDIAVKNQNIAEIKIEHGKLVVVEVEKPKRKWKGEFTAEDVINAE